MGNTAAHDPFDALVIGGGFFGCAIARMLAEAGRRVLLVERERELLTRASYNNQARVHHGYHYPRSFLTGLRSAANFARFVHDYADCIDSRFEHIYAIARSGSRTSAAQFRKFCARIGAPAEPPPARIRAWFDPRLIEDSFLVREYAFDALTLRRRMVAELESAGVAVRCGVEVDRLAAGRSEALTVMLTSGECVNVSDAFNCTYSGINDILGRSGLPLLPFKYELTELALVRMPGGLERVGFTVMDGPFFSTMPFPARRLHSFSHVRYTPHCWWDDRASAPPRADRPRANPESKFLFMRSDAQRYVPQLSGCEYVDSLYEVKTVLMENELDDGRPILLRRNHGLAGLHVVMGGKIDNVYDILAALEADFAPRRSGSPC